jgi:ATP-binding cassette, subfamily B, bacterial MsbA
MKNRKSTLRRILSFARSYWRSITAAIVCMLLFAFFSGASLGMILPLFDDVLSRQDAGAPSENLWTALDRNVGSSLDDLGSAVVGLRTADASAAGREVIEGVRVSLRTADRMQVLALVIGALVVLTILKNLLGFLQTFFLVKVEQGVVTDVRGKLYSHLLNLDMGFYTSSRSGDIIARFTSDVGNMNWALTEMLMSIPREVALLIIYLLLALWASWQLALVTLLVFPPAMIFILLLGRRLRRRTHLAQERFSDFTSILQETLFGIRIVKAFSMERFESIRFGKLLDLHRRTELSLQRDRAIAGPVTEIMGVLASGAIMWFGGRSILSGGSLTTGRFLVFLAAALSMMTPIKNISKANTRVQSGLASAQRVFGLMDRRSAIVLPEHPVPFDGLKEAIRFEDVHFRYIEDSPVLAGVTFTLAKGEIVALVGPSGGGKSTIADMIPRFYDPDSGSVTIDGTDLRRLDLASVRKCLGVVTQETVLFNDTVRNNIAYGEEDIPLDRVITALEAANAMEFVRDLPLGPDTVVGERGARLSGGQKQRLAIARAILKDPDILIFDEATSALDTHSERLVQAAIDGLIEGRTVLVIAHRLSTVTKATRVLYVDQGRIVEEGTHAELLARGGRYRRLFDMQFSHG